MAEAYIVVVQKWKERNGSGGWGYSIHLTDKDRDEFVRTYQAALAEIPLLEQGEPEGAPYRGMVDEKSYLKLKKTQNGLHVPSGIMPKKENSDNWNPASKK